MEDKNLVVRIKRGEMEAFETLVKKYQRGVMKFAQRLAGDRETAEEITQDAFFNVYRTIDRVDENRKFSTYLFQIVKNGAYSRLRKRKKTVPLEEEISLPEEGMPGEYGLKKILGNLSGKYRRVIELYYFEELSYGEMARRLRLPVNTIRTYLRRAKTALRTLLR